MARRRRERTPLNAEINVVSLIDVMMLLLVIFMITAPMMQGGIEVRLPRGEARPLERKSDLVVTVLSANQIAVGDTRMTMAEFRASFRTLAEQRARQGVYLRGDASVPYGEVVRVLGIMMQAGASNVGLVVEPAERQ
ncbi:MAG: biopolymer transporter ExbD [Gemmatimonadaceae bacterium]|nr:biopolymer transporter ExbD [Gemmatimonadaceae bacterium]